MRGPSAAARAIAVLVLSAGIRPFVTSWERVEQAQYGSRTHDSYQPKWWFKVEGVLDEKETL
jgi:hypothetical protein